jgi:hypothetical protein
VVDRAARLGTVALVRYQALRPSKSGRFPGVFALVNGLGFDDELSESERRWWRANNLWFESQLTDPFKLDPSLSDRLVHPHTSSWFRVDAAEYVDRTSGYLDILMRHRVAWVELRGETVGPQVFADEHRVIVSALHDPGSLGPHIDARRWYDGVEVHAY